MDRWYLRMNVALLKKALDDETDRWHHRRVEEQLGVAERELALFDANWTGVHGYTTRRPFNLSRDRRDAWSIKRIQREFEASAEPLMIIDPRPGLHIVDSNDAHAAAAMTDRNQIAGQCLFDAFPEDPRHPQRDRIKNVYDSFNLAAHRPKGHTLEAQRFDIRDSAGRFLERYWRTVRTPLRDGNGRLLYFLLQIKDVTAEYIREAAGRSLVGAIAWAGAFSVSF